MKQLATPQTRASWNSQFIEQLEFIKKQLRFPFKGRSMWLAITFYAIIPGSSILLYALFFLTSKGNAAFYWLLPLVLFTNLLVVRRYLRTLRFRPVPALPTTTENIRLLLNFLKSNHFAYHQHPQAPEVFQIISRNISASGEDREVLVFIADEGRILLNSHFTQSGSKLTMGTSHVREMAKDLRQFIVQQTELSS